MGLNLKKGEKISLTKQAPSLNKIIVGLLWEARATDGAGFDLDASAFLLTGSGKVRSDADFVFYGMAKIGGELITADGSVKHTGDNRVGGDNGDDEQLIVDLSKMVKEIERVVFTVTIYEAVKRKQTFGMVSNAKIRLVNADTNEEVLSYDLTETYTTETALEFGAIYKKDGEWKFDAIGSGYAGGLAAMCNRYGIDADSE